MKKIFTLLLTAGSIVFAQTSITTPTVSGTWTLAGSPYLVQVPVTVLDNDVLIIQPGVVVKMYAATKIDVNGQLIASGTSANPIIFEANDTTGWSNDSITAGGWNGIHYHQYAGSGTDNSTFTYCTVKDAKYGYFVASNYRNPFTIERGLKLHNAVFAHNTTGLGMVSSGPIIAVQTFQPTDTLDIYKCSIHDNYASTAVLSITNSPDGYSRVRSSHFYQNHRGGAITVNMGNIIIEDNELDHNDALYNSCPVMVVGWDAVVRRNKIHHNVSENYGGIACHYGSITVENNLVCNNIQTNAFCGFDQGGGGIHISCYGSDINGGFFIIRNNIIANNHGALGGGGLYVYHARTCISNNQVVNNYTPNSGSGIMINGPGSEVYMRSNLFHTQSSPGNVDTEKTVYVYNGSSIWFDYNYIPSNYSKAVQTGFSYTLYGDTLNNVIGTNPNLVAPTTDNNYLTDATSANFNIMSTSACINQGDTVGAFPALIDYAGNNRFNGIIDIGAYEYGQAGPTGIENIFDQEMGIMNVYPNPAFANTSFHITTPCNEGTLRVYDLSGRTVYSEQVTSEENMINLGPDARGVYIISFYGKKNATGRVMIR